MADDIPSAERQPEPLSDEALAAAWPDQAHITSFIAKAAGIDTVSRVPVARVGEVRIIEGPQPPAAMLHVKRARQVGEAPEPEPPSPAIPSEAELRAKLADALAEQHIADVAVVDAEAAHARSTRHLERAGCDLDRHSGSDAVLAASVADMLRGGDPDALDDTELHWRASAHERAKAVYASAAAASDLLQRELTQARGRAAEAASKAEQLIAAVLAFQADALATKHEAALAVAASVRATLLAFDHWVTGKGTGLSMRIRGVLGNNVQDFARRHDQSQWIAAGQRLRDDPMCEVDIG